MGCHCGWSQFDLGLGIVGLTLVLVLGGVALDGPVFKIDDFTMLGLEVKGQVTSLAPKTAELTLECST